MIISSTLERNLLAADFLNQILTTREQLVVAAFAVGLTTTQTAEALRVSKAAISKAARRIREKAEKYWS